MDLVDFFNKTVDKEKAILIAKNHDYAGKDNVDADPFFNLRLCEILKIASTETGMLVRMCDKFARMINFMRIKELKVLDEKYRQYHFGFSELSFSPKSLYGE